MLKLIRLSDGCRIPVRKQQSINSIVKNLFQSRVRDRSFITSWGGGGVIFLNELFLGG